jgi:hypothetical protein
MSIEMDIKLQSKFADGAIKFAEFLKDKSFFCEPADMWGTFYAIDADEMEEYLKEFLTRCFVKDEWK